jgi:RNA polymerase sigma factor (sigma-70 family)
MTKAFRKRAPFVLDLVDEPPSTGQDLDVDPSAPSVIEAFEAFYRREYPRLLVLARALAGAAAAEDVAQETMLVAYRRWSSIAMLDSPEGYVRGICLHKGTSVTRRLISERRALQRYSARRPSSQLEPLAPDSEQFWAEVRRLPRRQAQATVLFYALDLSVADIAETLGCAAGSVKSHLARARSVLAARLVDSEEPS